MTEPLASKQRPNKLDQFIGQDHLVGENGPIRKFIETGQIPSMIFWGPPGSGKTTLAYIISETMDYDFHKLLAVNSGKAKLRQIVKKAVENQKQNRKTILFLDEIHRWNKAQQDALLPYVEKGIITLIGATTENPSFTINNALLSRAKVFVFNPHTEKDVEKLLSDLIKKEYPNVKPEKKVLSLLANLANGDLRNALNSLEISLSLLDLSKETVKLTKSTVEQAVQKSLNYDRNGEEHYNLISAVHKSLRSSNVDAGCYWIMRMLVAGEDPLYIARRLLRFAAEDIGNADPQAVILANTVFESCQKLGMPECEVHLMQLAQYLANAPKDNSAYQLAAFTKKDAIEYGNLPVPLHIRNAPTKLMKNLGYSEGYEYDHDLKNKKSDQQVMPDQLKDRKYL